MMDTPRRLASISSNTIALTRRRERRAVSSTKILLHARREEHMSENRAWKPGRLVSLPDSTASEYSCRTIRFKRAARACSSRRWASIDTSERSLLDRRYITARLFVVDMRAKKSGELGIRQQVQVRLADGIEHDYSGALHLAALLPVKPFSRALTISMLKRIGHPFVLGCPAKIGGLK